MIGSRNAIPSIAFRLKNVGVPFAMEMQFGLESLEVSILRQF